jgi:hypothetical protein
VVMGLFEPECFGKIRIGVLVDYGVKEITAMGTFVCYVVLNLERSL